MTSPLFSAIRLADLELANRIVVSPMCQYSADDGVASDWHLNHLGMLANSGAALVVIEATGIERSGRISHGCFGLYSDDCEAALALVVAHCRRYGTAKIGIQLAHAGHMPPLLVEVSCKANTLHISNYGRRPRTDTSYPATG